MIVQTMFVAILLACALYDLTELRIPNFLNVMLIGLFILVVIVRPSSIDILGHGLVCLGVFAFGALCFYLGYWGGGDVKLYAASALWMGPELIISFIFCVSILAGIFCLCLLAVRRIISLLAAKYGNQADPEAFPKILTVGEGIPFAVPLSISAFLLMSQFPLKMWAF